MYIEPIRTGARLCGRTVEGTIKRMRGEDLSRRQLEILDRQVRRQLQYFNRLLERMTRLGWCVDDPLWQDAHAARDALQAFLGSTRYAGCTGVGKRRE